MPAMDSFKFNIEYEYAESQGWDWYNLTPIQKDVCEKVALDAASNPEDIAGKKIKIGDKIVLSLIQYRSARLMYGTVLAIDHNKGVQIEELSRSGRTWNKGNKRFYPDPGRMAVIS